jgi:peptidoglycan/LPS O-acetylase OafA/YrhL
MSRKINFDAATEAYFDVKSEPSPAVRGKLHARLALAEQKRAVKQRWLCVLAVTLFSAAICCVVFVMGGSTLLYGAALVNMLFTLAGGVLITLCDEKEKNGGARDVVLD